MATLFKTTGEEVEVTPKNGTDFQLEELQEMVGGSIEIVFLERGKMMVLNEEGKILGLPYNAKADAIYNSNFDQLVGDVLYCDEGEVK